MNSIVFFSFILSTYLCINAIPIDYENDLTAPGDLHTAETIWDLFKDGGNREYSGWGTGVQANPVPVVQTYPNYPTYVTYPNYGSYGSHGNYGKYPVSAYSSYGNFFPTYENYAVHGGHGFGKHGKH